MKSHSLSPKEAIILQLLTTKQKAYGLELVDDSGGHLKRGTIYVTLSRLEKKGFVRSWLAESKPGEMGPARRLYQLTADGSRVLTHWMASLQALNAHFAGL
ncbi:MAG: PadR family transcriptional regulator [Rhodothermales bacterium]